jgi:hypothetical protein
MLIKKILEKVLYNEPPAYGIGRYSSDDDRIKLIDCNGTETTVEEIVRCYYCNVNECFSTETRSIICHTAIRYDSLITLHISEEYYQNHQNDIKSQLSYSSHIESAVNEPDKSKYLFDQSESNNFLSSKNDSQADRHLEDKNAGDAIVGYDATDVGFRYLISYIIHFAKRILEPVASKWSH